MNDQAKLLWTIFWRTFAQLALAVILAVQGLDWVTSGGRKSSSTVLLLGLLAAFIGAVASVLWAWAATPAVSAIQKAFRSAAQAAAGGLGAIVLNQASDFYNLGKVLAAVLVAVVFAFGITFFQNQGAPPPPQPAG